MPGRSIRTFTVLPKLPERLAALHKLAYNLWWCWNPDAVALFRRVDPDLFESLDHSPIRVLGAVDQRKLEALAEDDGFLAHLDRVSTAFETYLAKPTWYQETYGKSNNLSIAYFSAEFGIHESVPVYSGGLGVLAGDHLKSASDLGIPLSGVSLMYREGYFRQYLNVDGWQQERYPENDFSNLPLIPELDAQGNPILIGVPIENREVKARIWRIQVGRIPLYLLDANIPQNNADDRAITAQLYGGDKHTRIKQELILGIGGLRALRAVGKEPTVCHMNEGHSAFAALERIRILMHEHKHDFPTAIEAVRSGTVFTTHTPVPAGNDVFPAAMMEQYLGPFAGSLGLDRYTFLALGRQNPRDESEDFGMTVLALKTSNVSNGVSKLHGRVSRHMWQKIWPELPENEIPITSITNGVHTTSWVAPDFAALYDRYLGQKWSEEPENAAVWARVEAIPDAELWRTHERCRERLVALCRSRLKKQLIARGISPSEVEAADEVLDPEALTIGFARRFATYKRGTLIFRDVERLAALVNNKDRPVQFVFSGKAHPKDTGGKELIAAVAQFARRKEFRRRIVFIEDYEMNICRHLIQGVDVWLNNPRRPLEASGTSGMKGPTNGGLNLSILDGWWVEGYSGDNGWAIGAGEEYTDLNYQDEIESRGLYELIEKDLIPTFYTRGADGLPRAWLKRMKRSIATIVPVFNTHRMVQEYMQVSYWPSHQRHEVLYADNLAKAKELARWRQNVNGAWSQVRIEHVEAPTQDALRVGADLPVKVRVFLGALAPENVEVQLYHGVLDNGGQIPIAKTVALTPVGEPSGGRWNYAGHITCSASGQYGYCVRILPKNPLLMNSVEPTLITWG